MYMCHCFVSVSIEGEIKYADFDREIKLLAWACQPLNDRLWPMKLLSSSLVWAVLLDQSRDCQRRLVVDAARVALLLNEK